MQDLVVVNPSARKEMLGSLEPLAGIEPPLWAALIAGFIRDYGHSVSIIDAEVEGLSPEEIAQKILELDPRLVAIVALGQNPSATSTPKMPAVRSLLNILDRQVKTALVGIHPSSLPERTLREEKVDYVCRGEGFWTILDLLQRSPIAASGLSFLYEGDFISTAKAPLVDVNLLPRAAWDLLPIERYRAHNWHCFGDLDNRQPYAVIFGSLGCPFYCHYCNIHALYNGRPGRRTRVPLAVVQEIDYLVESYKVKNFKFVDELFAFGTGYVTEICDLLIKRDYDLNIWVYGRIDTISEEMLEKMRRAGIRWIGYGIESINEDVRQSVGKKFKAQAILEAVEKTRQAGIYINGNFIFGLPEDSYETMRETLGVAKALNFEYVNFYTTMAYPGSDLYRITSPKDLPESWSGYGQYSPDATPLPTKHLASKTVLVFRDNAFQEYFQRPEYLSMILEKFGQNTVDHVKEMLKYPIRRNE